MWCLALHVSYTTAVRHAATLITHFCFPIHCTCAEPVYKFTSLVLLSAHITMWFKEYYKQTQFNQAVYSSTNTKYRVYRNT